MIHFESAVTYTTHGCRFIEILEYGPFFVSVFHLTAVSFER